MFEEQTTDLHDAAFRAGVWSVIEQRAKELKDAAKAELALLKPGDAVAGSYNGRPVAKASMVRGRNRCAVTDHTKFTEWVAARWPTEIVQTVNPAFLDRLKKDALDKGALIDADGEVCPFADVVKGEPYVSVRRDKDAEMVVAQLFSSGRLSLDEGVAVIEPSRWDEDLEAGAIGG